MRLAGLFRRTVSPEEAVRILRRLKTANSLISTVRMQLDIAPIESAWSLPEVQRTMGRLGERVDEVMRFQRGEAQFFDRDTAELDRIDANIARVRAEKLVTTLSDLAISGRDLQAIGYKQGKLLGEVLHRLYDDVVDGLVCNDSRILIERAQRYADGHVPKEA